MIKPAAHFCYLQVPDNQAFIDQIDTDIALLKIFSADRELEQILKTELNLIKGISRAKNIEFSSVSETKIYQMPNSLAEALWYIDLSA